MPAPASTYVRNAARILDEAKPDWFKRVNPNTLDMYSGTKCVLGQAFGPAKGEWFKKGQRNFAECGFDRAQEIPAIAKLINSETRVFTSTRYGPAWKNYITKRLTKKG